MVRRLADQLMSLDFDVEYEADEISSADGGRKHFSRYLESMLELMRAELQADRGFIALTGFEIGVFTPLAQFGYGPGLLENLSTSHTTKLESHLVRSKQSFILLTGATSLLSADVGGTIEHIHINVLGRGEIIGFMCLERLAGGKFDPLVLQNLRETVPLITSLIAEQNFSIRVHRLAQVFKAPDGAADELQSLFEGVADWTALAFAADAVVLRIFDAERSELKSVASRGEIEADLLAARQVGEHIAGRLLQSNDHDWAVFDNSDTDAPSGMPIEEADRAELRRTGVEACLIVRLTSEVSDVPEDMQIGTLAYHMRRPHRFSWRDLVLFRSFCQRVADAIALERQTVRLRRTAEELQERNLLLLAAYSQATNTDLIMILQHELFYSSFAACNALEDYVNRVTSRVSKQGLDDTQMKEQAETATIAIRRVYQTLWNLRSLHTSITKDGAEPPSEIRFKDVVDEIESVLTGPLKRMKISVKRNFGSDLKFAGPRQIFGYVIFNLVINSIDAAKTRSTARPMSIHIQARRETQGKGERLIIQFWDEGPGINRQVFRNPTDVFQIGKSTKLNGTGIGLPVTRQILHNHFGGNITLEDPATARFMIHIPMSSS